MKLIKDFLSDEVGFEIGEKSILIAMGVIMAYGSMKLIATPIKNAFIKLKSGLEN